MGQVECFGQGHELYGLSFWIWRVVLIPKLHQVIELEVLDSTFA